MGVEQEVGMFYPKPAKMPAFTMRLYTLIVFVLRLLTVSGRADSAPSANFTVA
jgi:hypothetical protein